MVGFKLRVDFYVDAPDNATAMAWVDTILADVDAHLDVGLEWNHDGDEIPTRAVRRSRPYTP